MALDAAPSAGAVRTDRLPFPRVDPFETETAVSLRYCSALTRREAKNFYYGMALTPRPHRDAMYALYAFMRLCDDLADGDVDEAEVLGAGAHAEVLQANGGEDEDADRLSGDAARRLAMIERFRAVTRRVVERNQLPELPAERSIWPAFRLLVRNYAIDPAHLEAMLDGQGADQRRNRYERFEQLYDYCFQVASVVGLVCVEIWGHDGEAATLRMAEHRGIALQLTNILRDLVEDAERDRVYLPEAELVEAGYADAEAFRAAIAARRRDEPFARLMIRQIERAASYYHSSARLEDRRVREDSNLPPEILLPGARQSHDVKCFALFQARRSVPHSATSFRASDGPSPWICVRSVPNTP